MSRAEYRERRRREMRELFARVGTVDHPTRRGRESGEITDPRCCYSSTCPVCGRVWLAVVKPIRPNSVDEHGEPAYTCPKHLDPERAE